MLQTSFKRVLQDSFYRSLLHDQTKKRKVYWDTREKCFLVYRYPASKFCCNLLYGRFLLIIRIQFESLGSALFSSLFWFFKSFVDSCASNNCTSSSSSSALCGVFCCCFLSCRCCSCWCFCCCRCGCVCLLQFCSFRFCCELRCSFSCSSASSCLSLMLSSFVKVFFVFLRTVES